MYYNNNLWRQNDFRPVINETPRYVSGQATFLKIFADHVQPIITEFVKNKDIVIRFNRSDGQISTEVELTDSHRSQ